MAVPQAQPAPPAARRAPAGKAQPEPPQQTSPAARRAPAGKAQRVYIKIAEDREQPALLAQLKALLSGHTGPLETVLFYEREQKTIALNDKTRVKPSRELFGEIERLLGKGSAIVK
jgi:DNA polymerase-3 subunit alpha